MDLGDRSAVDDRLSGVRVLVVDDNATNREVLRAHLTLARMRCDVSGSGEEALDKLVRGVTDHDPYELAVLDQHMPGMDGRDLARHIKRHPPILGTCLVLLASLAQPLAP